MKEVRTFLMFLRNAETFVDLIEVLWILRGLWLVAAIPCFGISLLGIAFGGNIVLGSSIFANGVECAYEQKQREYPEQSDRGNT